MRKFWLVLRQRTSFVDEGEHFYVSSRGLEFDTLRDAKIVAAERAGRTKEPHFVVECIGVQRPYYDPEIAWDAAK